MVNIQADRDFPYFTVRLDDLAGHERSKRQVPAAGQFCQIPCRKDALGTYRGQIPRSKTVTFTRSMCLICHPCVIEWFAPQFPWRPVTSGHAVHYYETFFSVGYSLRPKK